MRVGRPGRGRRARGDLETVRAIRASQRHEAGDDRAALRARSAILALPDAASDVLSFAPVEAHRRWPDVLAGLAAPEGRAREHPS